MYVTYNDNRVLVELVVREEYSLLFWGLCIIHDIASASIAAGS